MPFSWLCIWFLIVFDLCIFYTVATHININTHGHIEAICGVVLVAAAQYTDKVPIVIDYKLTETHTIHNTHTKSIYTMQKYQLF